MEPGLLVPHNCRRSPFDVQPDCEITGLAAKVVEFAIGGVLFLNIDPANLGRRNLTLISHDTDLFGVLVNFNPHLNS